MIIPAILRPVTGEVLVASPNLELREPVRRSFYEHRRPVQEETVAGHCYLPAPARNRAPVSRAI